MQMKNGIVTAAEARKQLLQTTNKVRGEPSPSGQKKDVHNRGRSYKRPDLDNRYFRSQAEANYARYLNLCIERGYFEITRWEYEPQEFEFPYKKGQRFYTPDFKVWFAGEKYEWHEVKGWMDAKSKTKLKRFEKHFPSENARLVLIDMARMREIGSMFAPLIPFWESNVDASPVNR